MYGRSGFDWVPPITGTLTASGDNDHDVSGGESSVLGQQPVQAGDADVVEPIDAVPHDLGRHDRLFGNGQIGRPGGHNQDGAAAVWEGLAAQCNGSRLFVK